MNFALLVLHVWHIHVFPHREQKMYHMDLVTVLKDTQLLLGFGRDCNISQCSFHLTSTAECELPGRTNTLCTVSDPQLPGYWHSINQGWEQAAHTYQGKGAGKKGEKGTWNAWPRVRGQRISELGGNFKRQVPITWTHAHHAHPHTSPSEISFNPNKFSKFNSPHTCTSLFVGTRMVAIAGMDNQMGGMHFFQVALMI